MEQLSGVMIIIIIGGGVLISVILFLFAKRQIMRFTLRSRRGPHVPVGNDAKKSIRREIERRLDCIRRIAYEPKLIWDDDIYTLKPDQPLPPHYYRMQAVDDIKILEKEITKNVGSVRHPHDSLRGYLLTTLASPLDSGQRMVQQFMDMYEHARHDPNEFGSEEYEAYHRLLLKLIDAAKLLKSFSNSRKTSPSRTPVKKQTKMHSFLDPSRLRPPSLNTGGSITNYRGNENRTAIENNDNVSGKNNSTANLSLFLNSPQDDPITTTTLMQPSLNDENEVLNISEDSIEKI